MNKTIRNLAIAALFIFPRLSGFPQEVQQAAVPAAPVSAQTAQAQPAQQANPLAGLITMADAKRIALTAAGCHLAVLQPGGAGTERRFTQVSLFSTLLCGRYGGVVDLGWVKGRGNLIIARSLRRTETCRSGALI